MLLVDTGVFLAAADDNDPDHDSCVAVLTNSNDVLVTTALVVAEAAYLIDRQLGAAAEAAFFRSLANGDARVESLSDRDFARTAELIGAADFPLGGTDASLVAVAERLGLQRIATLDHRHFERGATEPHRRVPSPPIAPVALPRGQRSQHGNVRLHYAVGAVAVALDHHLEVLVAEEVGDLAQGYVGVDHQ